MSTYQIINPEMILSSMMNNLDIVKQMINLYLTQGVEDFQNLEQAVNQNNNETIKASAHHIKPTMEYIGASDLRLKMQQLEQLALSNENSLPIHSLFQEIKVDFQKAMQELEAYYQTIA
ncbi:Hpt domain-containing protein [Sphingobacterium sp. HJSM2_6]|uniref:Hpt domain-containing protein n=1 Tax=Sphingobacterium sp. HJSM2_6 TaxID=3366264 RepID=UPI003BB9EE50